MHIYGKGCCCIYWFGWRCCGCGGGYNDDGCTCRRNADLIWKNTYDRGVGEYRRGYVVVPRVWTLAGAGCCMIIGFPVKPE